MKKNKTLIGLLFSNLLTIIFSILKLAGVIDWSWLWILSPLLFWVGLLTLALTGIFIASTIAFIADENHERKHGG